MLGAGKTRTEHEGEMRFGIYWIRVGRRARRPLENVVLWLAMADRIPDAKRSWRRVFRNAKNAARRYFASISLIIFFNRNKTTMIIYESPPRVQFTELTCATNRDPVKNRCNNNNINKRPGGGGGPSFFFFFYRINNALRCRLEEKIHF